MFRDLPKKFDFPTSEKEVLAFWEERQIFEKTLELRKDCTPFVFYEGPPTANGLPHPGHCLTRAIKDLFPRYKSMCGFRAERKGGWDTHGLPVEVEVSKELGIHSKEEIEEYGMEPFIKLCQKSVFKYVQEWEELTKRLGFWVDLDEAYVTYHRSYVESVWWALKQLFDAGLLYRGHKIVWWWAQGGTALSAGEVGQGYREVDDPSVFVRFRLEDEDADLVVWTTTPWTLPSNSFVAVNEKIEYARVFDEDTQERFYLAKDLVEPLAKKVKRTLSVEWTGLGFELLGRKYVPPFDGYFKEWRDFVGQTDRGTERVFWRVLSADFVTTDSGTGLVHEAPAFGEVDHELFVQEKSRFDNADQIPLFCAVAPDGRFTSEAPEAVRGVWVKEADKALARMLKDEGRMFHQEQYRHDYPFCWRADQDPLIQYPRESWFIRTTDFVDSMLANNKQITWLPEHIKDGRFGKFLESNVDWTLSRERYWGTPLPIWICEESGHQEAIGSYEELLAKPGLAGTEVWDRAKQEDPELCEDLIVHRPYVDSVTYDSPKAKGARMKRVPEVIDCWFDSGAMPFAQWGYPHQNVDSFRDQFPADFISEALDQTRGWFYSLLAISTLLFGDKGIANDLPEAPALDPSAPNGRGAIPYRHCVVLGLLKGEDGLKMSKSKKNYRTPNEIFDVQGADAMRWLMFSGNPPWTSIRFQTKAIAEGQSEFLIRLYNVFSFFVIYANLDGWSPTHGPFELPPSSDNELDRWILGELQNTTRSVRESLDRYESYPAARSLSEFVDGLSNWYLRRSRDRFWGEGLSDDKTSAYATLYHVLVELSRLSAPFVPFFSEMLYQNLVGSRPDAKDYPESVHLCDFPSCHDTAIDAGLSRTVDAVREIASLGHSVRAQSGLKVRLPLSGVDVICADPDLTRSLEGQRELIASELNVKEVRFATRADEYVTYAIKPNFRSIGPKYGKLAKAIQKTLGAIDDAAGLHSQLEQSGEIEIDLDGESVRLGREDVAVELSAKDGFAAAQGRTAVVVLSCEVTESLRREGRARDLVHHIQALRKSLDLDYAQRITLSVVGDSETDAVMSEWGDWIAGETLAEERTGTALDGVDTHELDLDGAKAEIAIQPR